MHTITVVLMCFLFAQSKCVLKYPGIEGEDGMVLDQGVEHYDTLQADDPHFFQTMFKDSKGEDEWHLIKRPNVFGSTLTKEVFKKFQGLKPCTQTMKPVARIPACYSCVVGTYWLSFLKDSSICLNKNKCKESYMGHTCLECGAKFNCTRDLRMVYDDFTCQTIKTQGSRLAAHDITDICKVEQLSIKQCRGAVRSIERLNWYVLDDVVYFVEGMKVVHRQDPLKITSYDCSGTCPKSECAKGLCSGQPEFCKHFGCSQMTKCKCEAKHESGHYEVKSRNGGTIIPQCLGSSEVVVFRNKRVVPRRQIQSCQNCAAVCSSRGIHLTTQTVQPFSYKICRSDYCIIGNGTGSPFEIDLPHSMMVGHEITVISLWLNNQKKPNQISLICEGQDLCNIIQCTFCMELWRNPSCYTSWTKMLIALIILSCLLFVTLTIWILSILFKSCRRIMKVICCCCRRTKSNLRTYKYTELNTEDDESVISSTSSKTPRKKKKLSSRFLLTATIIMLAPVALSCSETSTFQVTSSSCTYGALGVESCRVTNEVRLAVAPVGQDSCYIVKDPEGKPMGGIIVRTESVDLICEPDELYHVPEAESRCLSTRNCWRSGKCESTNCERWQEQDNIDGQPQAAYGTGWSFCKKVCGCAGCGCFYCVTSCLFYRKWLINPKKKTFIVRKCSQWIYEVDLTIIRTTATSVITERRVLVPGNKETTFNIDMTLISVSTPPQPILNECILESDTTASLVPCNLRGEYGMGRIGEIQCHSEEAAKGLDHCIADHKLITVTTGPDAISCRSSLVSPTSSLKTNLLPLHMEGMLIALNETRLVASLHSIAILELQMSSEDLHFQAQTEKNRCFAEVVEVSGCYSCLIGVDLSLKINTDFGSTVATLECEGINLHAPIRVSKKPHVANITFQVSKPSLSSECKLICPAGSTVFHLEATLKYIPPRDTRSKMQTIGVQINPRNHTISLPAMAWDVFSNSIWAKVILGLVVTMAVLAAIWLLVKICRPKKSVRFDFGKSE